MDLSTARWRKSSKSQGGGNQCVEVAAIPGAVAIRDSKDPGGAVHIVTPEAFRDLIAGIKRGEFGI